MIRKQIPVCFEAFFQTKQSKNILQGDQDKCVTD